MTKLHDFMERVDEETDKVLMNSEAAWKLGKDVAPKITISKWYIVGGILILLGMAMLSDGLTSFVLGFLAAMLAIFLVIKKSDKRAAAK